MGVAVVKSGLPSFGCGGSHDVGREGAQTTNNLRRPRVVGVVLFFTHAYIRKCGIDGGRGRGDLTSKHRHG